MAVIPWTNIVMDFLVGIPTSNRFVTILLIIGRFNKMLHLVSPKESSSAKDVVAVFLKTKSGYMVFPPASYPTLILFSKAYSERL